MNPIYLDYNATTPIAKEVADAMAPYLYGHFGNPSSTHPYGVRTKRAVEEARVRLASLLGCDPSEIVFTSGGTESNNTAIFGAALAHRDRGSHIITSSVEHPAVSEVCDALENQGFRITRLPVDAHGLVDPLHLEGALDDHTILVTVMHANNEVGTMQPIAELARMAKACGALFHTDAAQSVGKVPVRVDDLGVDLLSVAGHKLYAPKGVGALFIRTGTHLAKTTHGADHESGRRPGTENVLEIVGLGKAAEIAVRDLEAASAHLAAMRDRLHEKICGVVGEENVRLNGHPDARLPNTLSLSFRGVEANTLLAEVADRVAASAGAACHAEGVEISAVLEAMKVPMEWAMGTVRLSTGRGTTGEDVDRAASVLAEAALRLLPGSDGALSATPPAEAVRLTRFTHGLGCACKLRPQALEEILARFPAAEDANVIVGSGTSDDAAVYRLDGERALVFTVDFFTPVVDDPKTFGAIAAANSLSDVYAMGARPLFALNIAGFPQGRLPLGILSEILEGARDKAHEAGIPILGGHTVEDPEPKFGLAVAGIVHPDRLLRNDTAAPGDALILTKPLGLGILTTAIKRGLASEEDAVEASQLMAALNRAASEAAVEARASACTDITGFGLLGHLREMCAGSGMDAALEAAAVPALSSARRLAGMDAVPGGTLGNLEFVEPHVDFDGALDRVTRLLLADAQTSGGLLIAVGAGAADELLSRLSEKGVDAARIGAITGPGEGRIMVR